MNAETNKMTNELHQAGNLSERDFAALGLNTLAYVKPAEEGDGYMIHAADGTPLGQAESHEVALFAVRHYGLDPVSIH